MAESPNSRVVLLLLCCNKSRKSSSASCPFLLLPYRVSRLAANSAIRSSAHRPTDRYSQFIADTSSIHHPHLVDDDGRARCSNSSFFHHSPFLIPLASYVDDSSSNNTNKIYILRDLSRAWRLRLLLTHFGLCWYFINKAPAINTNIRRNDLTTK